MISAKQHQTHMYDKNYNLYKNSGYYIKFLINQFTLLHLTFILIGYTVLLCSTAFYVLWLSSRGPRNEITQFPEIITFMVRHVSFIMICRACTSVFFELCKALRTRGSTCRITIPPSFKLYHRKQFIPYWLAN